MSGLVVDHSKDGESQEAFIVGVLSACAIVSTACVALRIYTRAVILKKVGADDWVLMAAQALTIGSILIVGMGELSAVEAPFKSTMLIRLVTNCRKILWTRQACVVDHRHRELFEEFLG